jgi:hypothetical protein
MPRETKPRVRLLFLIAFEKRMISRPLAPRGSHFADHSAIF